MSHTNCPVCYSPLEARAVTPCVACGGRPESVACFDPAAAYTEYRLPDGRAIVLCGACVLEEFMVPGGWGYRLAPGEELPVNALRRVWVVEGPRLGMDKFCPACDLRLKFAEVVAGCQRPGGRA